MAKRPKPGSVEQKRESALAHRIEACDVRGALRRMDADERAGWRLAARAHERLVRAYITDLRALTQRFQRDREQGEAL